MIEIDGSLYSGLGTIIRDAVSLASLVSQGIHVINIRAKRKKPGLRHQHLKGILACNQICQGELEGASLSSKEITFRPGREIKGGKFRWDIGTAGSTTMLASMILPLALFAQKSSIHEIIGGIFQDFAPSVFHLKNVLFPILRRMGLDINIEIIQPGYVPKGNGIIKLMVNPQSEKLKTISLLKKGKLKEIKGIALSSLLEERKVSKRMAEKCYEELQGYYSEIEIAYDSKNSSFYKKVSIQPGASLAIWAKTDTGCLIGSDMAGKLGRSAEFIGKQVARNLIENLQTNATVDRYLADQLVPFCALADGTSEYLIPKITEHIKTRLWLVEKILGAKTSIKDNKVRIEGIGFFV